MLWTTSGDPTGFHLLVAEARTGYTWRTLATLAEPGFETDRWIGNVCFTGSGGHAVVVYAPRQFTNRERLFSRGGFAATVDVASGEVRKLKRTVSLAYYNPGCGTGESAVLTQSGLSDHGKTRVVVYDTARSREVRSHELKGQVTSAIPVGDRVVAAGGTGLEEVDAAGGRRTLARTHGPAFSIRPDLDGGVSFLEAHGDTTTVAKHLGGGEIRELARGPLGEVGLAAGTGGQVFLTGAPSSTGHLPAAVRRLSVPAQAEVSTRGEASVTHTIARDAQGRTISPTSPAEPRTVQPVSLKATVTKTGKQLDFQVLPGTRTSESIAQGRIPSPARGAKASHGIGPLADYGGVTIDPVRGCHIPRNDVGTQVYQPHWRQVEWAANLAVQGALTIQRPQDWKESSLPAWSPQGMFPRRKLVTGTDHRVPAQIMLGVLAQESNMWQASPHVLEGVYGNPLIGNFYGLINEDHSATWTINWDESDCGYGAAQVTDKMRLSDTGRSWAEKQAIAVDYASNIAAGLQILEEKYNQTWQANIRINSGNPKWIENWFAALWAYNTGMQPRDAEYGNTTGCQPSPTCHDGRGNWGLGWLNNPINPEYPADRTPFLNGPSGGGSPQDAARPQRWPYPEKVMGWAAFPIIKENPFAGTWHQGYAQAWWTHAQFRTQVKPPRSLFCDQSNHCDPGQTSPCLDAESRCWWNTAVVYKPNCLGTLPGDTTQYVSCGQETMTFNSGAAEPADWNEWYKPNCSPAGVPEGSYIIDDVPNGMVQPRGCHPGPAHAGSFRFDFAPDSTGQHRSKIDFHQIGGGFNGHFWFTHTRAAALSQDFRVTGTWKLDFALVNKCQRRPNFDPLTTSES
ncbi:hypothetical protein [Nonomuraea sp. NPDC049480]|uniref:hypothetical protein n=1 Tax=Nonomuraea sp. NPDC049480 TaxID=3364353 RepID=UPI0037A6D25D